MTAPPGRKAVRADAKGGGLPPEEACRRLARGEAPPCAALVGNEPFLKEQVADAIVKAWGPRLRSDGDGPDAPPPGVLAEGDLFAEHRVVEIRCADAWAKRHAATLCAWMEAPSASTRLVLHFDDTLDGRTALAKRIAAAGWVVECRRPWATPPPWKNLPPWDHDLGAWVRARAQGTYGKRMTGPAAHVLVARAGESLALLDGALATLATYVGARGEILEPEIDALFGVDSPEPAYRVADALVRGDGEAARAALGALLERGFSDREGRVETSAAAAASVLVGDLSRLLAAGSRVRPDDPAAFRISPRVRQAAALPPRAVAAAFAAIHRADRDLKSGERSAEAACWRLLDDVAKALAKPGRPGLRVS